jgi:hypothetical protein
LGGLGTVLVHLDLQHPRKLKKMQKKTQFLPPKSHPKKIKISTILRYYFETPFEKVLEPIFCLCKPQEKPKGAQTAPKGAQTAVGRCENPQKTALGKVLFSYAKTIVSEPRAHQNTRKIVKRRLEAIKRPSRNKKKRA